MREASPVASLPPRQRLVRHTGTNVHPALNEVGAGRCFPSLQGSKSTRFSIRFSEQIHPRNPD